MNDWFGRWLDWQDEHPRFMQLVVVILAAVTLYEAWKGMR